MIFIDGMDGMAWGMLFTFGFGTIMQALGELLSKDFGDLLITLGGIAIMLTGAGIAMGITIKVPVAPTIAIPTLLTGMIGAHADAIYQSSIITNEGAVKLTGPGDPLGACIAVLATIVVGNIISGKTDWDLLLTPVVCFFSGSCAGLLFAPASDYLNHLFARSLEWATHQHVILMGILISCLMCIYTMLPISTLALLNVANLSGLPAGAATIGCCCSLVGYALASFQDNKYPGLALQGLGTSKLQLANTIKKPYILLPPLLSSAILGGISTGIFKLTNSAKGAAYGTTGLVGCIKAYNNIHKEMGSTEALIVISLLCFVLPGALSLGIAEGMRKLKWLKEGDMKISA